MAADYLENLPGYVLHGPIQLYLGLTNWSQVDGVVTNTASTNHPSVLANWNNAYAMSGVSQTNTNTVNTITNAWHPGDVLRGEAMSGSSLSQGPIRLYAYRNGACILEYLDFTNSNFATYAGMGMGYSDSTLAISNWTGGDLPSSNPGDPSGHGSGICSECDYDDFLRPTGLLGGNPTVGGYWASTLPSAGSIKISSSNAVIAEGGFMGPAWAVYCDTWLAGDQSVQTTIPASVPDGWIGVTARNTASDTTNTFYLLLDYENTATMLFAYNSSLWPAFPFYQLGSTYTGTNWSPGDTMILQAVGSPPGTVTLTALRQPQGSSTATTLFTYTASSTNEFNGSYAGMAMCGPGPVYMTNWYASCLSCE